jgi:hypothetical protein
MVRLLGKALPNGGTRYATAAGEYDIVFDGDFWVLLSRGCVHGIRRFGPDGRKQCVSYLERWVQDCIRRKASRDF